MLKPGCYECKFRGSVPGSAHSSCKHPATVPVQENSMAGLFAALSGGHIPPASVEGITVKGDPHGVRNGWFGWPFNFDPVWLVECSGFEAAQQTLAVDASQDGSQSDDGSGSRH